MTMTRQNITALTHIVRYGKAPNSPQILNSFLKESELLAEIGETTEKLNQHLRTAQVLLDTICDSLVPKHWRLQCLDNIYRPLHHAQRVAKNEQEQTKINRFQYEMNATVPYFF